MKIVFLSNYFNHHQKFLADEFFETLGDEFSFIATVPMNDERKNLGWKQYQQDYVLYSYESDESYQRCMDQINTADVVIVGSAPEEMVRQRIRNGKLTFRYSERLLKKGLELKKFPYRYIRFHRNNPRNKPVYLLCASAYTAADYAHFGLFRNKAFKWGYFPEVKHYENIDEMIARKNPMEILWCGRLIELKHTEDAIRAVARLVEEGYPCTLKIIGTGVEEDRLKILTSELNCTKNIFFLGAAPSDEVRAHMEKAGIFLFTSDFNEGWGVVLNESMNSGCAVVASHAIGSAPFLIDNNKNGLLYANGDICDLYSQIKYLLDNPQEQLRTGKQAYKTIIDTWNPRIAAERFVKLCDNILNEGLNSSFVDGPCSKADLLKNNWYSAKQK